MPGCEKLSATILVLIGLAYFAQGNVSEDDPGPRSVTARSAEFGDMDHLHHVWRARRQRLERLGAAENR
jgi:hypothetical protein